MENIKCTGEVTGQIECFAVEGEVKGDTVYAQISKTGGKLLMFEFFNTKTCYNMVKTSISKMTSAGSAIIGGAIFAERASDETFTA